MVVVAGEAGMVGEVFGGIDAGERAEVVDKVRLIEIAAIDSDIGPPNGPTRRDAAEHALETANAAFSAGNLEKWNRTGRTERDANYVVLFTGVDGEGLGARARESTTVDGKHLAGVVRIVEAALVFGEIDDDRDAAVGHEAFFDVGRRVIAVIPEALDKASERRARSEKQPFHVEMVRQSGGSGRGVPRVAR